MPQAVPLSDGETFANIPDGANNDQINDLVNQAEARLATHYGKQAEAQNSPVTTPGHIYSATTTYPNSYMGAAMAWLDHNAGGNWMNRNIVQPTNEATDGAADAVAGSVGRIESNVPGIVDIPAAVYNTAKHYTPLGTKYDAPYLTEGIRNEVGVPELDPGGGFWGQRALEGGTSALLGGGSSGGITELPSLLEAARAYGGAGLSTALSDFGGMVGGEAGSLFGGLFGGGAGEAGARKIFHTAGRVWGHPEAPQIAQDYDATVGGTPSSTTLSSPPGQRILKILGALPLVGSPIENANEETRAGIQRVRDESAAAIAGPGGIPPRITDESIGEPLVRGAQQGSVALKAKQNTAYNNINQIMEESGKEVDLAPAASAIEREQNLRPTTEKNVNTVRGLLGEATDFAPGGPMYDERTRGPTPPLPQSTLNVPWSVAKDVGTQLKNRVRAAAQQGLSIPDTMVAALKDSVNAAMARATQSAGLRGIYDKARTSYAEMKPILDRLYSVGGKPVGDTGSFEKTMGSGEAARNVLYANRQNSDALAPFADSSTFPNADWRRATGQWIGTMGNADQGTFRPEHFYRDWTGSKPGEGLSDKVQQQVTQGPGGQPLGVADTLSRLANVAKNVVTPISRHGLMSGLGAAAAVEAVMRAAEGMGHAIMPPGFGFLGGAAAPTALGYGLAKGVESEPYKRGATGQSLMSPQTRANFTTRNLPIAGAVTSGEINDRRTLAAQTELMRRRAAGEIP